VIFTLESKISGLDFNGYKSNKASYFQHEHIGDNGSLRNFKMTGFQKENGYLFILLENTFLGPIA